MKNSFMTFFLFLLLFNLSSADTEIQDDLATQNTQNVSFERAPLSQKYVYNTGDKTPTMFRGINGPAYGFEALGDQFIKFWLNAPANTTVQGPLSGNYYCGDFAEDGIFYAIDNTTRNFVGVDTANGVATVLGTSTPQAGHTWTGMSYDAITGTMWGSSTDGNTSALYTIDMTTGATTLVTTTTVTPLLIDIAMHPNSGILYLHDLGDNIYTYDPTSGTISLVGPTGFDANYAQGMDFNPETGELYLAAYSGAGAELRQVNLTTGNTSLIGPIGSGGEVCAFGIAGVSGDSLDPRPPTNFTAYSDYRTPSQMALRWTDPTILVGGTPISPSEFTIEIERDGAPLTSIAGGTENYTDTGLNDGQVYEYGIYAKLVANDSTSNTVLASWTAGGARQPMPPAAFVITDPGTGQLRAHWINPSRNIDGTPMDDFAAIRLYEDGLLLTTFTRSPADTGRADSADFTPSTGPHTDYLTAVDNETPPFESNPSNSSFSLVPPIMAVTPSSISDTLLVNQIKTLTFTIANNQTDPSNLHFTVSESPPAAWLAASPLNGTILSMGQTKIEVTLDATSLPTGPYVAELVVSGNDPNNPEDRVQISMRVNPAPVVDFDPDSMRFAVLVNEADSAQMTIYNTGAGLLEFDLTKMSVTGENAPESANDRFSADTESGLKMEIDPSIKEKRDAVIRKRSKESVTVNAFPEDQLLPERISILPDYLDGEEIFGSMASAFSGGLRDRGNIFRVTRETTLIEHKLYLDIPVSTEIYFFVYRGTALAGQFNKVNEVFLANSGTGQGFYSSGRIAVPLEAGYFYYIGASWNGSATYYRGTEITPVPCSFGSLETGIAGNLANYPPAATTNNPYSGYPPYYCAIVTGVDWLSMNPSAGTIPPGGSMDIWVTANSAGLLGGEYFAGVKINSNDPVTPDTSMLVHMTVIGIPDISTNPDSVIFSDTLFTGGRESRTLQIVNSGNGILNVSNITSTNSVFTVDTTHFIVPPLQNFDVEVNFAPLTAGSYSGILRISSNDPLIPLVEVPVEGGAIPAPQALITPNFQNPVSIHVNDSVDVSVTIANTGANPLTWSARARHGNRSFFNDTPGINLSANFPQKAADGPLSIASLENMAGGWAYASDLSSLRFIRFNLNSPADTTMISSTTPVGLAAGDFNDDGIFYAIDVNSTSLVTVDTSTGAITTVGSMPPATWTGLAYDPSGGIWYAVSTNVSTASTLYTINPSSGTTTIIGSTTDAPVIVGIAIDNSGNMYAHDISLNMIFSIDKSSGAATPVGPTGITASLSHQDMDFDAATNTLYMASYNTSGVSELRTVDLVTGSTTLIGPIGTGLSVIGAFAVAEPYRSWITLLEPTSGTVNPANQVDLQVRLYGMVQMRDTTLSGRIEISTNDPVNPLVLIDVVVNVITGIEDQHAVPAEFMVHQNYPNPFNPITTIKFDLPKDSKVILKVFNILGEEVDNLVSERLSAGSYAFEWDASSLASGIYLYRLEAEGVVQTRKMILLR